MEENIALTPKVLKKCWDILLSPSYVKYSTPMEVNVSHKYANHPDLQYFKEIKAKNNYHFHKYKRSPSTTRTNETTVSSDFDPFDRKALVSRIATFTPLNWQIPFDTSSSVSELKCAQNGWTCLSVSSTLSNKKNHLLCVYCNKLLTLKYNDLQDGTIELDIHEYQDLNSQLSRDYVEQITHSAHDRNCPWRNFETPLDVYYLRPYMENNNKLFIESYLQTLRSLIDNSRFILTTKSTFNQLNAYKTKDVAEFVRISKIWLVRKHFFNDKENMSTKLDKLPDWLFLVAMWGWGSIVLSHGGFSILLLLCSQCNKRIFLDDPGTKSSNYINGVDPPHTSRNPKIFVTPYTDSSDSIDLESEHKTWCSMLKETGSLSVTDYLFALITASESSIGQNGELRNDIDTHLVANNNPEGKTTFDVNDGLDRLHKMRKLYLLDE